jgi:hypothetical protein
MADPLDDLAARIRAREHSDASLNTTAVSDVPPAQAVDALRNGPLVGVAPSVAMQDPTQVNQGARIATIQGALNNSGVRTWAARATPAQLAATQDDFTSLAGIASKINSFTKSSLLDIWRSVHAADQAVGAGARRVSATPWASTEDAPLGKIGAIGSSILDALNVAGFVPSYLTGKGLQALTAGMPNDLTGVRGNPEFDMFRPSTWLQQRELAPNEVKPYTQSVMGASLLGLGFAEGLSGVLGMQFKRPVRPIVDEGLFRDTQPRLTGPVSYTDAEFADHPVPGTSPAADVVYQQHALQFEQTLKETEEAVTASQTQARLPALTEDFVKTVTPDTKFQIDPEAWDTLTPEQHALVVDQGLDTKGISDAYAAGHPYEISAAEYLSKVSGTPLADALRPYMSADGGISATAAKELEKAHPVTELKTGEDLDKVFTQGSKAQEAVHKFLDAVDTVNPSGTIQVDQAIAMAKALESQDVQNLNWKDQQLLEAWNSLKSVAGVKKEARTAEEKPASEPAVDEDTIAAMADQGMSPYDYYTQTGKEFPEPEDLDIAGLNDDEKAQWEVAKQGVQQAIPKLAKERFLDRLFSELPPGMTKPQYVAYSARVGKAFDDLVQKLWHQTYNNVKSQYTKEWKQVYQNIFPTVMNEFMADPGIMAAHTLRFSKVVADDIVKDNVLVHNGKPITYYHGSKKFTNLGTEENPWRPVNYPVISFSTDPQFASRWAHGDAFDPFYSAPSPSEEGQTFQPTIFVVNIKAKNPADFRKAEDVQKAAEWHAEQELKQWDQLSDTEKRYAINNQGMSGEINAGTRAEYGKRLAQSKKHALANGSWTMWEVPEMWKDIGWDAAHMKESASSALNICIADGNQIYFRYRPMTESPGMKLALDTKKSYPKELWEKLPNNMFSKEHGRDADIVAQELGFSSGQEMLEKVSRVEAMRGDAPFRKWVKDTIESETNKLARSQVGDILSPEKIMADARVLFTSPEASDILVSELKALSEIVGKPLSKNDIIADAKARFDNLPLSKVLRPRDYAVAVKKWGDASQLAMTKGKPDYLAAFEARQKQVLNFLHMQMSFELQKEFQSGVKQMKVAAKNPQTAKMTQVARNAQRWIVKQVGFPLSLKGKEDATAGMTQATFVDYLDSLKESGYQPVHVEVTPVDKITQLTVDQFRGISQMVKSIGEIGRDQQKIYANRKAVELTKIVEEIKANASRQGRVLTKGELHNLQGTLSGKSRALKRNLGAHVLRMETPFFWLDSETVGPLSKYVIAPLEEGKFEKHAMINEMAKDFKRFVKGQPKGWVESLDKKMNIPEPSMRTRMAIQFLG